MNRVAKYLEPLDDGQPHRWLQFEKAVRRTRWAFLCGLITLVATLFWLGQEVAQPWYAIGCISQLCVGLGLMALSRFFFDDRLEGIMLECGYGEHHLDLVPTFGSVL